MLEGQFGLKYIASPGVDLRHQHRARLTDDDC